MRVDPPPLLPRWLRIVLFLIPGAAFVAFTIAAGSTPKDKQASAFIFGPCFLVIALGALYVHAATSSRQQVMRSAFVHAMAGVVPIIGVLILSGGGKNEMASLF